MKGLLFTCARVSEPRVNQVLFISGVRDRPNFMSVRLILLPSFWSTGKKFAPAYSRGKFKRVGEAVVTLELQATHSLYCTWCMSCAHALFLIQLCYSQED